MRINDRYEIVSDDLNIILRKRNVKEDGNYSNFTNILYFTDFKSALQAMIKREIFGTGFDDFKTVCDKMEELEKLVKNLEVK